MFRLQCCDHFLLRALAIMSGRAGLRTNVIPFDPKPFENSRSRNGARSRAGRFQFDLFFDSIFFNMQTHGCTLGELNKRATI